MEDPEELFEDISPPSDEQLDDFSGIEQKLESTKEVEHELEGAYEQNLKSSTRSEQEKESVQGSEQDKKSSSRSEQEIESVQGSEQDKKSSSRFEQEIESVQGSEHEEENSSKSLSADLMKLIIENETVSNNKTEPTCKPTPLSCDTVDGVQPSKQVLNQPPKPVQLKTMSLGLRKPKLTFTG